jgi:asparagine synthase (glutamine-hydrolysing)
MCGIAGGISWAANSRHYLTNVDNAVEALRRRGPDSSGSYIGTQLALGHARLAIFDTSEAAAQPFHSACGRYIIVFNGEIFNFREHRNRLSLDGIVFRSNSDTEVLLELFIREGENCLQHLNGFFAFGVADLQQQSLFIARDRFGEKPLQVYRGNGILLFASTIQALQNFGIPRQFNAAALQAYLHLNYIPPQLSVLENVAPLHSGSWMKIAVDGKITEQIWYQQPAPSWPQPTFAEATTMLREKLTAAVERRLAADVPLGAFLSGGIDSSVVAALAAKFNPKLRTFSIGFPDTPLFDETAHARLVASHIGTAHTVFPVSQHDLAASLDDTIAAMDEPFADTSALAVNILSRLVRSEVTVALSGDGADELLGGYNKHRAAYMMLHRGMREKLVAAGAPLWNILPASRNSFLGNRVRQLRRFAEGAALKDANRYWRWAGYTAGREALSLLLPEWQRQNALSIEAYLPQLSFTGADNMNSILHADTAFVLPGDMLVKVDRMSMHHGLEIRPPFLDHEVAGWLSTLPSDYKIDAQQQKRLLKVAFADLLPPEIFTRRKQGFEVPILQWLRTDLRAELNDLLSDERLSRQGIFDPDAVAALQKQLNSSDPGDAAARIWALYVFQRKYAALFGA